MLSGLHNLVRLNVAFVLNRKNDKLMNNIDLNKSRCADILKYHILHMFIFCIKINEIIRIIFFIKKKKNVEFFYCISFSTPTAVFEKD